MLNKNYQAWDVKIADFPYQSPLREKLLFLIRFAVLAPSSHNSQPWQFAVKDDRIFVYPNLQRRLLHGDAKNRLLYQSIGCAIENIVIAADYYGLIATVQYHEVHTDSGAVAIIIFTERSPTANNNDHLIFSLVQRVTNRNHYSPNVPNLDFLKPITQSVTDDVTTFVITDKQVKDQLADVALDASVAAMNDNAFRAELSEYVKSNVTKSSLGMPCFGMGIPTPVSLIAPTMIKYLNMNRLSHRSDEKLLKEQTPVFIVIAARYDMMKAWLEVGRLYERIAVAAQQQKLATAMWASPIQIGEFFQSFQKILQTDLRPQVFFRLGRPQKNTPHSPRLAAVSVMAQK